MSISQIAEGLLPSSPQFSFKFPHDLFLGGIISLGTFNSARRFIEEKNVSFNEELFSSIRPTRQHQWEMVVRGAGLISWSCWLVDYAAQRFFLNPGSLFKLAMNVTFVASTQIGGLKALTGARELSDSYFSGDYIHMPAERIASGLFEASLNFSFTAYSLIKIIEITTVGAFAHLSNFFMFTGFICLGSTVYLNGLIADPGLDRCHFFAPAAPHVL